MSLLSNPDVVDGVSMQADIASLQSLCSVSVAHKHAWRDVALWRSKQACLQIYNEQRILFVKEGMLLCDNKNYPYRYIVVHDAPDPTRAHPIIDEFVARSGKTISIVVYDIDVAMHFLMRVYMTHGLINLQIMTIGEIDCVTLMLANICMWISFHKCKYNVGTRAADAILSATNLRIIYFGYYFDCEECFRAVCTSSSILYAASYGGLTVYMGLHTHNIAPCPSHISPDDLFQPPSSIFPMSSYMMNAAKELRVPLQSIRIYDEYPFKKTANVYQKVVLECTLEGVKPFPKSDTVFYHGTSLVNAIGIMKECMLLASQRLGKVFATNKVMVALDHMYAKPHIIDDMQSMKIVVMIKDNDFVTMGSLRRNGDEVYNVVRPKVAHLLLFMYSAS